MIAIAAATTLVIVAAAGSASAQSGFPNATSLALVDAQYNASGFDTPIGNSLAFNLPLQSQALLEVNYAGVGVVSNGQALSAAQVANKPTLTVWPAQGSNLNASTQFTIMLADASALGIPDAQGDYRHYLANSASAPTGFNGTGSFDLTNGTVITDYAGPGPIAGTGPHRYAWLLFDQPSNFSPPANLSTAGVAPNHWDVNSYVTSSDLGPLVAASFFTVENGAPTGTVLSSSAVNTATLSVSSTPSGSASSSGAGAAAASGNGNGAASNSAGMAAAMGIALMGGLAMLA